jgi:hypothetical protein
MKIHINNQSYILSNTPESVASLFELLDTITNETKTVVSQMTINQSEIYENYREVIIGNLSEINVIDVEIKSIHSMVLDLVKEILNYSHQLLLATEDVSSGFYNSPNSEQWESFQQYFEGVIWVIDALDKVSLHTDYEEVISVETHIILKEVAGSIVEAMEAKDYTLIADLLKYEVVDALKDLLKIYNYEVII